MSTPAIQQRLQRERDSLNSGLSHYNTDIDTALQQIPLHKLQPLEYSDNHSHIDDHDKKQHDSDSVSGNHKAQPPTVLVACGSYSPITNMHLRIFEQARNYLQCSQKAYTVIGGIISPVHDTYGKSSLVDASHRIAMCESAVDRHPWLTVSRYEVEQNQWTPTANVLEIYSKVLNDKKNSKIREMYGSDVQIGVMLLCGADLLNSVLVPDLWSNEHLHTIFGKFGVAVIERVGMDLKKLINETPILKQYEHNIHIIPQTISNTISSTSVRDLLKSNESVRYLIPDDVVEYIVDHELYGVDKELYRKRHLLNRSKKDG